MKGMASTTPAQAPALPISSNHTIQIPTHVTKQQLALSVGYRYAIEDVETKKRNITLKYQNISNMNHDEKLTALKDMSVNPFMLDNAYDGLTNTLQRWKNLATSPETAKLDPISKTHAAINFYRTQIVPMYERMKATPPSEENFVNHAYGEALKWDMDTAYQSHWRHGFYSAEESFANVGKFALASLAGQIHGSVDIIKSLITTAVPGLDPKHDFISTVMNYYHETQLKGTYAVEEEQAKNTPIIGAMYNSLERAHDYNEFWKDINPNETWGQKARSFVFEQALQLPLFEGLGAVTGVAVKGAEGLNLTKTLMSTPAGRVAFKGLMNGGEGLAYGYAVRDSNDKQNAWQDAVGAAVLGTVFHIAGEKLKLKEVGSPEIKSRIEDQEENHELAKQGLKIGDADSLESPMKKTTAGNMSAGGVPTQTSIFENALSIVRDTQGMTRKQIKNLVDLDIQKDPALMKPTHEAASYIRAILKNMKVKNLEDLTPELQKDLLGRLHNHMEQSGEEISSRVEDAVEGAKNKAAKFSDTKEARGTVERLAKAIELRAQKAGLPIDKDRFLKLAKQKYAMDNAKASIIANKETSSKPLKTVIDIEARAEEAVKTKPFTSPTEDPGYSRLHTKYWSDREGRKNVSVNVEREWKSYLKNKTGQTKWTPSEVSKYVAKLDPEDFHDEVKKFFYPKELSKAGIFFEHEGTKEGDTHPNFLAFMYNYKDSMPPAYAQRLSEELEDTVKFEKNFNPKIDTEIQKRYYAEAMYNHVNDFLQSGRFPKEANIFRSTLSDLRNPTVYQKELHLEAIENEKSIINSMFKKNPEAKEQAMAVYNVLMKETSCL